MYIPKHWHFAVSTFVALLGFYIMHTIRKAYGFVTGEVWIVFFVLQFIAVVHVTYIYKMGLKYQAYITKEPVDQITNWHTGAIVDTVPPVSVVQTVPVYNQVAPLPRFDKERYFAFTLVRMHENNFKVDMTETRWVKNWKFSRGEFTSMMDNWKLRGIIERESDKKNSPYAVAKWEAVKLIAQGERLPPLPY